MSVKVKMSLIILVTLIVGMLLGALIQGAFMRNQFHKRITRLRTPEGFMRRFERVIRPTEEQKPEIDKILLKNFERFNKRLTPPVQEMGRIMDTLRMELDPVLTPEQKARLHRHFEHMRRFPPPPPGRPPGKPPWRKRHFQ